MVAVTVNLGGGGTRFSHKEADNFFFGDGILHIQRGKERIAAYPLDGVVGVEKTDCCTCKSTDGGLPLCNSHSHDPA